MAYTKTTSAGKRAQLLAVLTATLAVMSDGVHYGWSSPAIPILEDLDSPVGVITENEAFWIEALYWIGGICALPLTILTVDCLGRRRSILAASALNLVCWVAIALTTHIMVVYVARFAAGGAANTAFVAAPMYIAECVDPSTRGMLGASIYTMMMVGTLLAYCVVPFLPIWGSCIIGAGINVLQLLTFMWMPETPYFHLLKKKEDKAEKSLKWLRGTDNVAEELENIAAAVERQSKERGRPQDLMATASNRRAVLIMLMLNCAQHMAGISVMLMNIQSIFGKAGNLHLSPVTCSIIFGCVMLSALFVGAPLVDRCGRKALLIGSSLVTACNLALLGGYFLGESMDAWSENGPAGFVPLLAVLAYAFSYRVGLGLVPIVITGEIFPTSVKAMGMTLADFIYNVMGMVSIRIYYWTSTTWGIHTPFLLFSACCLIFAVATWFLIPETKGKTLEEIQLKLKRKTKEIVLEDRNDNRVELGLNLKETRQ